MKKIIILLGLLLVLSPIANAAECNYKCVEPYDMSGKISSFFSNITGLNFTRTKISEAVLKKTLSKSIQSNKNLDVDIDSYSARDLANGIFKSLLIKGEDLNIDGIYLSSLQLKSLCEFNYIQYDKKGNLTFKEDFPMSFKIQMSNNDLNKTMKSERYQKLINNVNKLGKAGLKITATEASIRGNKFFYDVTVSIPFFKEQKIGLTADIKVNDGKIDFEKTRLTSGSLKLDLNKADFLIKHLNPLDFSVNIFDNKDAKVYIKNVSIKNNIIVSDGIVIIPKD